MEARQQRLNNFSSLINRYKSLKLHLDISSLLVLELKTVYPAVPQHMSTATTKHELSLSFTLNLKNATQLFLQK